MFQGRLLAISVASGAGAPMQYISEVEAAAGRGLSTDRYAMLSGTFQKPAQPKVEPGQEVTLIEQEALEAAQREYDLPLTHAESRRNLLTSGVPLNHLVGRRFTIGSVVLEGVKLCEPCGYLERFTGKKVIEALRHRGGLRARIVQGGVLRVGDPIAEG